MTNVNLTNKKTEKNCQQKMRRLDIYNSKNQIESMREKIFEL